MKVRTTITTTALALLAAGLGLAVIPGHAQIINGDFANGLAGYTTVGDASIRDGGAFLTTATLVNQDDAPAAAGAFNFSGAPAVDSTDNLDLFAGLASGALDPDPNSFVFAFEGTGLKQVFNIPAGQAISFQYRLFTNDPAADYGFVAINGALSVLDLASSATTASTPFAFEGGLNTFFSPVFASAQSVTLAIGVVDVNDFNGTTALFVDNLQIVPEPSTVVLGLVAAALAGIVGRRRKRSVRATA